MHNTRAFAIRYLFLLSSHQLQEKNNGSDFPADDSIAYLENAGNKKQQKDKNIP